MDVREWLDQPDSPPFFTDSPHRGSDILATIESVGAGFHGTTHVSRPDHPQWIEIEEQATATTNDGLSKAEQDVSAVAPEGVDSSVTRL